MVIALRRREEMRRVVVVLTAALIGASSIASTSAVAIQAGTLKVDADAFPLAKRHGDHEHEGEEMAMESSEMTHAMVLTAPVQSQIESHSHEMEHKHEHEHEHEHGHSGHKHELNPYDAVPDPLLQNEDTFIPVPQLPKGSGGHSHGGHGEPKLNLNESIILRSKGPDPLSYVEWDFAFGLGKSDALLRFSSFAEKGASQMMGVSGKRWRTLLDEKNNSKRMDIASDIKSRVQENPEEPGRHRSLLLLHVVGCVISCFVLLPLGECS